MLLYYGKALVRLRYTWVWVFLISATTVQSDPMLSSGVMGNEETHKLQKEVPALYSYYVVNDRLDTIIAEIARDTKNRIQHSPSVRGRITRKTFEGSLVDILDEISTLYGLEWFSYNSSFYLSNQSEAATRMIRLGDLSLEDTLTALGKSNLLFEKFPIIATSEDAVISITGPPKLIAIVESVIEGIPSDIQEPREADLRTIRVRRALELQNEIIQ